MAASHGIFAPADQPFDMDYLMNNFIEQHQASCKRTDLQIVNPIEYKLLQPNKKYPYTHYTINFAVVMSDHFSLSDVNRFFYQRLLAFFNDHHISVKKGAAGKIVISQEQLTNAKLTYKDAHDFLFDLNQQTREQEVKMKAELEEYKEKCGTFTHRP